MYQEAEERELGASEATQETHNAKARLDAAKAREQELRKSDRSFNQDQNAMQKAALDLEEKLVEQELKAGEIRRKKSAVATDSSTVDLDAELLAAEKELQLLKADHLSELQQLGISEKLAAITATQLEKAHVAVTVQVGSEVRAADASTKAMAAAAVARDNATHAAEEYNLRRAEDEQVQSAMISEQDTQVQMLRLKNEQESAQLKDAEAKEEHAQKAAKQSLKGLTEASEVESNARKAKALAKLQPDKEDFDKAQKKIAETTGSEKAAHEAMEQAKMRAAQEELEAKQQEEWLANVMRVATGIQSDLMATEDKTRKERLQVNYTDDNRGEKQH